MNTHTHIYAHVRMHKNIHTHTTIILSYHNYPVLESSRISPVLVIQPRTWTTYCMSRPWLFRTRTVFCEDDNNEKDKSPQEKLSMYKQYKMHIHVNIKQLSWKHKLGDFTPASSCFYYAIFEKCKCLHLKKSWHCHFDDIDSKNITDLIQYAL